MNMPRQAIPLTKPTLSHDRIRILCINQPTKTFANLNAILIILENRDKWSKDLKFLDINDIQRRNVQTKQKKIFKI